LVHGLADENVHFLHTATLIEALLEEGKPYALQVGSAAGKKGPPIARQRRSYRWACVCGAQVMPSERHGVRKPSAKAHTMASIADFLLKRL
jgi:dipeptidyl aminopeptidase/acylaminoacyl peptidase